MASSSARSVISIERSASSLCTKSPRALRRWLVSTSTSTPGVVIEHRNPSSMRRCTSVLYAIDVKILSLPCTSEPPASLYGVAVHPTIFIFGLISSRPRMSARYMPSSECGIRCASSMLIKST